MKKLCKPTPIQNPMQDRWAASNEAIEWKDYPRILPGGYSAYRYWGKRYRDPGLHRWTCLLRWDVLSEDLLRIIAHCIPMWFSPGDEEKPTHREGGNICQPG